MILKYNIYLFSNFFVLPKKPSRIWALENIYIIQIRSLTRELRWQGLEVTRVWTFDGYSILC